MKTASKPPKNGSALSNGSNGSRDFATIPLGELLNRDGRATIAGGLHLASLRTIGDVLALHRERLGVLDALIDRNFSGDDAKTILGAIEGRWQADGHQGEPWGAAAPAAQDLEVPLKLIMPSPLNPRKRFDQAELDELTASVKAHGVLQPILVRPAERVTTVRKKLTDKITVAEVNGREAAYELICGERRYRAAQAAGLATIPCKVRQLDDRAVREIRLVENEQRSDLTALEKADGYAELIDKDGYTVEQLAGAVHKSPATIYGLLKLRQLPAPARAAVEDGKLPVSTAQLVARIPNDKLRAEAANEVLGIKPKPSRWRQYDEKGPLSYRDAKGLIEERFMIELKQAPFDRKSLELLPSAGACTACPKMTGNARAQYPDARGDICTDPACYRQKLEAHAQASVAGVKGAKFVSGKAAEKYLRYPGSQQYLELDRQCYEDRKDRTYSTLLREALKSGELVRIMAIDERGELHELADGEQARKILKRDKLIEKRPSFHSGSRAGDKSIARATAKQANEARLHEDLKVELAKQAAAKVEAALAGGPHAWGESQAELFRALIATPIDLAWGFDSSVREVLLRRLPGEKPNGDQGPLLHKLVASLSPPAILVLLAELGAVQNAPDRHRCRGPKDPIREQFWKGLGINPEKVKAGLEKAAAKKGKETAKA